MTTPRLSSGGDAAEEAPTPAEPEERSAALGRIVESLSELAGDMSTPKNVRRGAQSAKDELSKPLTALDVRLASAVNVLDELASDSNLPTDGRTAIWSILSNLERLK